MSVLDDVDTDIATLAPVVPTPTAPFAYGVDVSCTTTIADDWGEVDATSTLAIGEALVRRLITPNGTLWDDPDYGEDVRGYLNRATTERELRDLASKVRNECAKDDRVESCTVSVTLAGTALSIAVRIAPVDATLGTFTLTLALTDAGLLLEEIRGS